MAAEAKRFAFGAEETRSEPRKSEICKPQAARSTHQAPGRADGAAERAQGRDRDAPGRPGGLSGCGGAERAAARPGVRGQGARAGRGGVARAGEVSMIAIDWGTSSLRAYRLDAQGNVLESRASNQGILKVAPGQFPRVLEEQIGGWEEAPIVMS